MNNDRKVDNQIYETKNNFKKHEQVQDIHKLDKEMELKQFSERITRRLYKRILLEELRRVPKAEWIQFTKQIAEVDISESKYLNVLSKITNRISEIEVEQGERKVLAMSRRDIDFLKHLYDTNPQLILDIKRTVGIRDTYKTGERAGQFKDELKLIKDFTLEELNLFKNELKARIEFRQKNPVKILKNNTLETGDIPGYKNIKSIKINKIYI